MNYIGEENRAQAANKDKIKQEVSRSRVRRSWTVEPDTGAYLYIDSNGKIKRIQPEFTLNKSENPSYYDLSV